MRDPEEFVGGGQHVVNADARLCRSGPDCFASVVFRAREELDDLLIALTALRDGWDQQTAHIHLQDHKLFGENRDGDPTRLEIMFFTPTWADTETEREIRDDLIANARKSLEEL